MDVKLRAVLAVAFGTLAMVLVAAAAAYACVNYVGYMRANGSGSSNTVTVTGLDTWNGPEWMQQTVSAAVAAAPQAGTFKVYTSGINTTNKYLQQGTYDVNVQKGTSAADYGYTNHTTWNNPGGDCMTWTLGINTVRVGKVTYNAGTDGVIDAAEDLATPPNNKYLGAGWAGNFSLPSGIATSPGSYEQAVCISSSDSVNGHQAPLDVIGGTGGGLCTEIYNVTAPRNPAGATALYMIFGDGQYETVAIPQGSGSASFSFTHTFPRSGTFDQIARIVETGGFAEATTVAVGC